MSAMVKTSYLKQACKGFFRDIDVLTIMLLCTSAMLLYSPILGQYWTTDDTPILESVVVHGVWRHFWDPAVWAHHLPMPPTWGVLTPWVMLSLGIDWALGGLDPSLAYFHHLLSIGAVVGLLYILLRRFLGRAGVMVTITLFVLSPPFSEAAHFLMERHYLEGLALYILSCLFYLKAVKKQSVLWSLASMMSYAAACTAKEIFVPLAALLPLLPHGQGLCRPRWSLLWPHVLVLIFYVIWRGYMLTPNYIFGYGGEPTPSIRIEKLLGIYNIGMYFLASDDKWRKLIAAIWGILLLTALLRNGWMVAVRGLTMLIVSLVPIYPLLDMPQIRLYFLPWLTGALGCGFVVDWLMGLMQQEVWARQMLRFGRIQFPLGNGVIMVFSWSAILVVMIGYLHPWENLKKPYHDRFALEGKLALTAPQGMALLHPISWPIDYWWFIVALSKLRHEVLRQPETLAACYDPCICSQLGPRPSLQVVQGQLVETLWPISRDEAVCGDRKAPLKVHFEIKHNYATTMLYWQFGPYDSKGYFELELSNITEKIYGFKTRVRSIGKYPLGKDVLQVIVRWVSEEGWSVVSPPFVISKKNIDESIRWQRPNGLAQD